MMCESAMMTSNAPSVDGASRVGALHGRPHDLLRLRRLPRQDDEPAWVREAFARAPFAVVRRAPAGPGCFAVGVRGLTRAERYGAWVTPDDIEAVIVPEDLAEVVLSPQRYALPAFAALGALQRNASTLYGFVWGPVGSVGFELATKMPTVIASSDLDLLIRAPDPLPYDAAVRMLRELQAYTKYTGVRIDAQLETPVGGIALTELAMGKPRVMARGARGPIWVADPWLPPTDATNPAFDVA